MWTGNKDIASVEKHIPRYRTILEAGDMVYNPVWMWHKVTSKFESVFSRQSFTYMMSVPDFGGLSIGVPVREVHITGLGYNMMFSFTVFSNKLMHKLLGVTYNGYPPPSAATEADN